MNRAVICNAQKKKADKHAGYGKYDGKNRICLDKDTAEQRACNSGTGPGTVLGSKPAIQGRAFEVLGDPAHKKIPV